MRLALQRSRCQIGFAEIGLSEVGRFEVGPSKSALVRLAPAPGWAPLRLALLRKASRGRPR